MTIIQTAFADTMEVKRNNYGRVELSIENECRITDVELSDANALALIQAITGLGLTAPVETTEPPSSSC